jgi:hypothetical protein
MHNDLTSKTSGRTGEGPGMARTDSPWPHGRRQSTDSAFSPAPEPSPPARPSLNLSEDEVREAAGGYRSSACQLEELHRRGFVRAYRSGFNGTVVLERAHYEAVTRGFFGLLTAAANEPVERKRPEPDRAGFMARFGKKKEA